MSEINTNDTALTDESAVSLPFRTYGIDLRVILLALRYEMLHQRVIFSPNHTHISDVIIPTLRYKFSTYIKDGNLILTARRKVKLPIEIEDGMLSVRTIDILVAYLEKIKINKAKLALFSKPSRIDRSDIPTLEFL